MPPQSPGLVADGYPVGVETIGIGVGLDVNCVKGLFEGLDVKGISVG